MPCANQRARPVQQFPKRHAANNLRRHNPHRRPHTVRFAWTPAHPVKARDHQHRRPLLLRPLLLLASASPAARQLLDLVRTESCVVCDASLPAPDKHFLRRLLLAYVLDGVTIVREATGRSPYLRPLVSCKELSKLPPPRRLSSCPYYWLVASSVAHIAQHGS